MKKYPPEVLEFIEKNAPGMRIKALAKKANAEMGTTFSAKSLASYMKNHKITNGLPHGLVKGERPSEVWPEEIRSYIFENYKGVGPLEMAKRLNETFGTDFRKSQVKGFYGRNKLDSGVTGYYEKGNVPFNKGRKGMISGAGCEKGWFKKGNVPHNHLPIGSVVTRSDGYLVKKIGEPDEWKELHRLIWEEANGPIPEGQMIIFLDRDKKNLNLENFALISKKEHMELVRRNLRTDDAKLTEAGVLIARAIVVAKERRKNK